MKSWRGEHPMEILSSRPQPDEPSRAEAPDAVTWPLKNIVEMTPSSMALFDTGMRFLAVSKQFLIDNYVLKGETQQSIVGRDPFDFWSRCSREIP